MPPASRSSISIPFSISFVMLTVLLSVVWLAGGASRADMLGQVVVRVVAWFGLILVVLTGERPAFDRLMPPAIVLAIVILLPLLQLVPLPAAVWEALPGRSVLTEAAIASNQPQPWRPWSIAPAATVNAVGSLVVPVAVLVLVAGLREREHQWLPGLLLSLVVAGMIVALLQFSGAGFNNALINGTPGDVSGTFANRNHFALFLAIGCVLAPVWAFAEGRKPHWRGPTAAALVLVFVLMILATGSRAGMIVGAVGTGLGLLLVRQAVGRALRGAPRWVQPLIIGGVVVILATFIFISIAADRAESINRLIAIDTAGDTRVRALPAVIGMIQTYFPAGTGFGSFDPVFRLNEPYYMLNPNYLNHAHNDFLEIVLDGGLPAIALLLVAMLWWLVASVRVWRAKSAGTMVARTGSAMVLLVAIASVFDYPARTPAIMAMIAIGAAWLARGGNIPSGQKV